MIEQTFHGLRFLRIQVAARLVSENLQQIDVETRELEVLSGAALGHFNVAQEKRNRFGQNTDEIEKLWLRVLRSWPGHLGTGDHGALSRDFAVVPRLLAARCRRLRGFGLDRRGNTPCGQIRSQFAIGRKHPLVCYLEIVLTQCPNLVGNRSKGHSWVQGRIQPIDMTDRLAKLESLIDHLRGPDGCAWDREQKLPDLRSFLLEEAHEVAAAIDVENREALAAELGDLLFQILFIARIGTKAGPIPLDGVIDGIHQKMVDRHPHVFGSEKLAEKLDTADAVHEAWEKRKAREPAGPADRSVLDGVPTTLPALVGAYRMTQKVAGVGFDWIDAVEVLNKLDEERGELLDALEPPATAERVFEEIGDLLFTAANLARKVGCDPESALQAANRKFLRRFRAMEEKLGGAAKLSGRSREDLERAWHEVKNEERFVEPE